MSFRIVLLYLLPTESSGLLCNVVHVFHQKRLEHDKKAVLDFGHALALVRCSDPRLVGPSAGIIFGCLMQQWSFGPSHLLSEMNNQVRKLISWITSKHWFLKWWCCGCQKGKDCYMMDGLIDSLAQKKQQTQLDQGVMSVAGCLFFCKRSSDYDWLWVLTSFFLQATAHCVVKMIPKTSFWSLFTPLHELWCSYTVHLFSLCRSGFWPKLHTCKRQK